MMSYRVGGGGALKSPLNWYSTPLTFFMSRNGYAFGAYRPAATRSFCVPRSLTTAITGMGWNEPMPSGGLGWFLTVGYAWPSYDGSSVAMLSYVPVRVNCIE